MKRTTRFLARLYPSSWRQRYGVELDALLEDVRPSARVAFDVFWGASRMQMTTWGLGRIVLACSLAGVLVATAITFAVPLRYKSQAVLTVTPADESALRVVNHLDRSIFSRASLAVVIQEHDLYPRERARMPLDEVIDIMKRSLRVHTIPPALPWKRDRLTFVIEFDYPDRHVAQQVNTELASAFIVGNLGPQLSSRATLELREPSSLPRRPTEPNRTRYAALGLLAGLLAGLTLAIVVRSRRGTTICPTCGRRAAEHLAVSPQIS